MSDLPSLSEIRKSIANAKIEEIEMHILTKEDVATLYPQDDEDNW